MRKIIYWVHVSLDGHISGPNGEFDWPVFGPELARYSHEENDRVDTFLYGRAVWDLMSSYWPTADENTTEEHARYFAPIWRATPKVVFSKTLTHADWNTRVISDDLETAVKALKSEPGKDMQLTGGAGVAAALAELDLIDEYQVVVHPVVLGGGKQLFPLVPRFTLELVETRVFDGQTVLMRHVRSR
ncbi:dihydrofolate reductase family protein [Actinophytocola sp.]|jgi:dihydrofolate reductase|uniref:dihydrofolate reductase family protein n=1 Tax=Actinophytocola sp. TaxID=1872138 RepID=UPI002ED9238A